MFIDLARRGLLIAYSAKIKRFCENNNIHDYDIIELKNIIDTTQQKIPFPDL